MANLIAGPELLALIQSATIFSDLNPNEARALLTIASRRYYKKNELIFSRDEQASFFYMIEEGSCLLSLQNDDNKTYEVGDTFGELAVINDQLRSGSMWAAEDSTLIAFQGPALFDNTIIDPAISLKVVRNMARQAVLYLRSREHISTWEVVQQGEGEYVEFKSTLRWNLHSQAKDKAIENASLKTIAAFMNSQGGTLLVGVADDMSLLGLENDRFANDDKLLLHLTNLIKSRIGTMFLEFLDIDIENVKGKKILRVDCNPATMPAFLKDGQNEYFYVRTGPATTNVSISKIYAYIRRRFK